MNGKWLHKYQRKPGRWVFAPTLQTKAFGRKLKEQIDQVWQAPDYFFHLRAGGHVKALKVHQGQSSFLRLDIEDFFGSVNRSRVTRCLKQYFGYAKAREFAVESTVQHPTEKGRFMLPFGFVQSPILASIALAESRLGACLQTIATTPGFVVSVYVDDIVISGPDDESLKQWATVIAEAAQKSKFPLNSGKQDGPTRSITAFSIVLQCSGIELMPDRLASFKKVFQDATSEHQKMGIVGYVRSIDAAQADSLTS